MSSKPIFDPIPPLSTRISLYIRTWLFKTTVKLVFSTVQFLKPQLFRKYAPTYTKRYPVRPMLECRVHVPKTYQSGQSLPLYIDIHGGAFIIGSPTLDDKYCSTICNRFNYIVVSLQYRLAPSYPFPIPSDDCTELALAVLNDPDLPIDRKKVMIGGQSAGGNLALSVAQDDRIRSKLKAVVAWYPSTDISHVYSGDYRDIPADANGKGAQKDSLRPIVPLATWSYPPVGQDLTNPRLSPIYADKTSLPERIFFITAEHDKLCQEAFHMACKLAKRDNVNEAESWEQNGIRWERLPNEVHGFIEEGWRTELFKDSNPPFKSEVDAVIGRVGEWLEAALRS